MNSEGSIRERLKCLIRPILVETVFEMARLTSGTARAHLGDEQSVPEEDDSLIEAPSPFLDLESPQTFQALSNIVLRRLADSIAIS